MTSIICKISQGQMFSLLFSVSSFCHSSKKSFVPSILLTRMPKNSLLYTRAQYNHNGALNASYNIRECITYHCTLPYIVQYTYVQIKRSFATALMGEVHLSIKR